MDATQPQIDVQLLDVNPYSRPGTTIDHVNGIVVHYTANPGSTAQDNRDYFNGLKDSHETSASSNFVIGLEGEIIQCIPTWEMAYASNDRNADTISIECCHPDENGKFTDATYRSLVQLTAWLCAKYDLTADQVIRHYDVTGKICPKYFVIGLEGEIIQCIPTWEMAYASNDRNADTISIECCHPDENGKFTDATYRSLVQLTAWLCAKYDLTADQVIRHYDVTGKICPKYFVEDEEAWVEFRKNVQDALEK